VPARATLFGNPTSHYCVSAERTLAFKRTPLDMVYVSYYDKRPLLRATGQDYVPALVWDGKVVTPMAWATHPVTEAPVSVGAG
jgi:glutathione S-transferase